MRLFPFVVVALLAGCSSTAETNATSPATPGSTSETMTPTTVAPTTVAPTTLASTTLASTTTTSTAPEIAMSRETFLAVDDCIDKLVGFLSIDYADDAIEGLNEESTVCGEARDQLRADRLGDSALAEAIEERLGLVTNMYMMLRLGMATETDVTEFNDQFSETRSRLTRLLDSMYGA
jgi:hypothetical protein